jgi:hypothetical protein
VRVATVALAFLLTGLLSPASAGDVPLHPQSDLGLGQDAPDSPDGAWRIAPGEHAGRIHPTPLLVEYTTDPVSDPEDWYAIKLKKNQRVDFNLHMLPWNLLGIPRTLVIELYTPDLNVAAMTWADSPAVNRPNSVVTSQGGWWYVRVWGTIEADYRFSITIGSTSGFAAAHAGDGWLAVGVTVEPGGAVEAYFNATARRQEGDVYALQSFVLNAETLEPTWWDWRLGFSTYAGASVRAGDHVVDTSREYGRMWPLGRSQWASITEPGTYWLLIFAAAPDHYVWIDVNPQGPVKIHRAVHGAPDRVHAYRLQDFNGGAGVVAANLVASLGLWAQIDIHDRVLGLFHCGDSNALCTIVDPTGATQHLSRELKMLNSGEPGSWLFTRNHEAKVARANYALVVADVGLPRLK